jgi:hypothetical protein
MQACAWNVPSSVWMRMLDRARSAVSNQVSAQVTSHARAPLHRSGSNARTFITTLLEAL